MEPLSPSHLPSSSEVEVMKQAIKQVMEEVGVSDGDSRTSDDGFFAVDDGEDRRQRRLLFKLISQLETLKAEENQEAGAAVPKPDPTSKYDRNLSSRDGEEKEEEEEEEEEIVKEIKEVKRQNLITHCLLSVMIVLTVAWQISEVSLILRVKEGVAHPLRSIGSIFTGMLKPHKYNRNNGDEKESSRHDLKIPEIPHVELPKLDLGYDEQLQE